MLRNVKTMYDFELTMSIHVFAHIANIVSDVATFLKQQTEDMSK